MTKLVEINTVCNGSTGKIMGDIAREYIKNGGKAICFYGRRKGYKDVPCEKIGGFFSFWLHVIITTLFDKQGHGSYFKTKKLIKRIKQENPDIIHLHNIHGYYLNYPLLFTYLKNEFKGKLYWTLHDCWAFTGHCPHFVLANCYRWKKQCHNCPNKKLYPISLICDNSFNNYLEKKKLFTGLDNLKILTPSNWLNNYVKQSYLKEYDVITIPNGIDFNIFKKKLDNNIYNKYKIPKNKKIILGVANIWDDRKGLDQFIRLSKQITDDYIIVLIGLNKNQIKKMPSNIIGIKRTENQNDLAIIYSIANVFINPSKEETFSLVTLESLVCETPVIVYNNTAMCEFVDEKCGIIVESEINFDVVNMASNIKVNLKNLKKYKKENIYKKIIDLYNNDGER